MSFRGLSIAWCTEKCTVEGKMNEEYFVLYRKEDGYYYYYFYRYGKRVRRSTGCKRKSEAFMVASDRLKRGDLANEGRHVRYKTFAEYAEPFFIWDQCPIIRDKVERGGHYSKEFAYICRRHVEKYIIPAFGKKYLPEINPAMVSAFLRSMPKRYGVTPQTANKVLSVLRQILDHAVMENQLEDNPVRKVKPLVEKANVRGCFTPAQIKRLFSEPWNDLYVELACRLAAVTGMRCGEVRGLLKENVYADYVVVEHSYSDREKLKSTKSGKVRVVPIPPELADQLRDTPNNGPYVFSYTGTTPLTQGTIGDKLKQHMKDCGIDSQFLGLSFHSFRHFFNTQLVANGVEENKILAVVGHSSVKMTQHYLHLEAGDLGQIRAVQTAI